MSRRTLSHFLNRDSDKKKKSPCKHFFGLFFTSREREKKIVPPLRGSDFLFSDFPHAYAWGSRGCAAPPALAPATRETPQQIRPRRNSPEPPAARGSKPSVRRRNRLRPLASRRRIRPPKRRSCRRTQSLEEAAQAPHGNASFSSAFPHLQYTRANPRVRTSAPSAARHSSCGVPASAKPRRGGTISAREAKPSADCAVPPALAPATHETRKQNHHSAKNSPETFRRARIRVFNTHISPSSSYAYPSFRYTSVTGFFPRTKKKSVPAEKSDGNAS